MRKMRGQTILKFPYHSFNKFKKVRSGILKSNLNILYVAIYVLVLTCLSVASVQAETCSIGRRAVGIGLINPYPTNMENRVSS